MRVLKNVLKKNKDIKVEIDNEVKPYEKKYNELKNNNIKETESFKKELEKIKKGVSNQSDVTEILLEEFSNQEDKKLYGDSIVENSTVNFNNKKLNDFIFLLLNKIVGKIIIEEELSEYQKQFMKTFMMIIDQTEFKDTEFEKLESIESNDYNKMIYIVICDFLILGEENMGIQILDEIDEQINLSKRIRDEIYSSTKKIFGIYGYDIIIGKYKNLKKEENQSELTNNIDEYNSQNSINSLESNLDEEIICLEKNCKLVNITEILFFWKKIINYFDFSSGDTLFNYSRNFNLKEKSKIQIIIENLKIENICSVNDIIAYSPKFILTINYLIISKRHDILESEIDHADLLIINLDMVKLFSYYEDEEYNYNNELGFPDEYYAWPYGIESELYIEMKNGEIIDVKANTHFRNDLLESLYYRFFSDLLKVIVNNNDFEQNDSLNFITFRNYIDKRPFNWSTFEKSLEMKIETILKGNTEFGMLMNVVGKEHDISQFENCPRKLVIKRNGLFLDEHLIYEVEEVIKGNFYCDYQNKFFSFSNFGKIYFRTHDGQSKYVYLEKGVGLKSTEEDLKSTTEFLNSYIFLMNISMLEKSSVEKNNENPVYDIFSQMLNY